MGEHGYLQIVFSPMKYLLSSGYSLTFIRSYILTIWINKQEMVLIFGPDGPFVKKNK